jgi:hypothetical protein
MLTTRASDHIRKSKNIRGRHSCSTSTGFPLFHLDARRLVQEEAALATRNLRRAWLEHLWNWHEGWRRELRRA